MPSLKDLYDLRHDLSLARQSRHKDRLLILDRVLRDSRSGKDNSYEYNRVLYSELMDEDCFKEGSRGYARKIKGHEYIYRLVGAAQLARFSGVRWFATVRGNRPSRTIYNYLKAHQKAPGQWLPLRRFAVGRLSSPRNFAFWTTHNLDSGDIIDNAHHIGLTNNWLKRWSVLLRCRVDSLTRANVARVPTVIDAYTSVIFHPTKDADKPPHGVTIKLKGAGSLCQGVEEYVLGPIEAEKIQLRPVFVNFWKEPYISAMHPDVWDRLAGYYEGLKPPPSHATRP